MAEKKEKRYLSDNAQLIAEWNWERNTDVAPSQLTLGSNKKAWWKCQKGHEWQAIISNRSKGSGCPYCTGQKVLKGYNDLHTLNPMLAQEWNYEKNGNLKPEHFTANSGKKAYWKCSKGHEWQATISNRNKGSGCPYCSGFLAIKGENDLQTVNPTLAQEWNHELNSGLIPANLLPNSNEKVWWKCKKGHVWKAKITDRNNGSACPYCAGKQVLKGYNDLQTVNPILAKEWNYEKNTGLIPAEVTPNSGKKVWWKCQKGHEWCATIKNRNKGQGCPVCNSERHTSFPEYALVYYIEKYGLDVVHSYREKGYELDIYIPSKKIAIEYDGYYWHKNKVKRDLEKNLKCRKDGIKLYRIREELLPLNDSSIDYVVQESQKDLPKILEEILSEIVGANLDVDIERDAIAIENLREYTEKNSSILHLNPKIAKEWNCEKNGNLKPEHFAANSNKKAWWKCTKGHEWQATVANRNLGRGCPYCAGKKIFKGCNDLQTVNPILAKEWNYEKNTELMPADVTPNSGKKVWWKCSKGHEWQTTIKSRNRGSRCPYCAGQKAINGYNDLRTVNPTLANEWNYEKNNGLTPADVMPNSGRKVWWKCSKGHEWRATIGSRNKGSGCTECYKERKSKG